MLTFELLESDIKSLQGVWIDNLRLSVHQMIWNLIQVVVNVCSTLRSRDDVTINTFILLSWLATLQSSVLWLSFV